MGHGRTADTFWTRAKGLLGTSSLAPGDGLIIQPCRNIHSFGMRYAFDAVFVDRDGKVLHVVSRMPPNRISRYVLGAHAVVELPPGTIEATNTQTGDKLWIEKRSE
jgi:uncharacterized protein